MIPSLKAWIFELHRLNTTSLKLSLILIDVLRVINKPDHMRAGQSFIVYNRPIFNSYEPNDSQKCQVSYTTLGEGFDWLWEKDRADLPVKRAKQPGTRFLPE